MVLWAVILTTLVPFAVLSTAWITNPCNKMFIVFVVIIFVHNGYLQ